MVVFYSSIVMGGGKMKKFLFIMLLLSVVIGTMGCSNGAYNSKEAIKRGDVVYQVDVVNLERFEIS